MRNPFPPSAAGPPVWLRLRWQAASLLHPGGTARALERLWFTPPRARSSPDALRLIDAARSEWALVTGQGASRRVRVYRWGTEGPVVLLAHGWGGHAGQWHALVHALLGAGMRVVALRCAISRGLRCRRTRAEPDLLAGDGTLAAGRGAGRSGRSMQWSAIRSGGAAAAQAIREGLPVRGAVMIGSPADMGESCAALAWQLGIAPGILARMRQQSEQWLGTSWATFNVPDVARTRPVPPALVIHDRDDKEVRWEDGAAIAGRGRRRSW